MMTILLVLCLWFALSIPAALFMGAVLRLDDDAAYEGVLYDEPI